MCLGKKLFLWPIGLKCLFFDPIPFFIFYLFKISWIKKWQEHKKLLQSKKKCHALQTTITEILSYWGLIFTIVCSSFYLKVH